MAEGAEGGLYVAHEFVDAPGVLAAGHSGIAAGDAFDEIDKCLFKLVNIADCRDMPEKRQEEDCGAWHGAPRLRRPFRQM